MFRRKPAPDLIGGGHRFADENMRQIEERSSAGGFHAGSRLASAAARVAAPRRAQSPHQQRARVGHRHGIAYGRALRKRRRQARAGRGRGALAPPCGGSPRAAAACRRCAGRRGRVPRRVVPVAQPVEARGDEHRACADSRARAACARAVLATRDDRERADHEFGAARIRRRTRPDRRRAVMRGTICDVHRCGYRGGSRACPAGTRVQDRRGAEPWSGRADRAKVRARGLAIDPDFPICTADDRGSCGRLGPDGHRSVSTDEDEPRGKPGRDHRSEPEWHSESKTMR